MRYKYTSQGYLNSITNSHLTAVKQLIIVNIIIFFAMLMSNSINQLALNNFALKPVDVCSQFYIWQCVTYAFLHSTESIWHILFNMIGLWFLGPELESRWGKKKFLRYYFVIAIGSGIITAIYMFNIMPNIKTIGASGAIYGLLVAYAILFPNRYIYLYGILPLKVRNAAIIFGGIALYYSINMDYNSNISHIAHLSGMVMAFIYLFYLMKQKQSMRIIKTNRKKYANEMQAREQVINKILDKINATGWESLTEDEEKYLKQESQNNHFNQNPN